MNDREHELMEADLRRLKPAAPPAEFLARLAACRPASPEETVPARREPAGPPAWLVLLRWLAPAAAVAALVAGLLVWKLPRPTPQQHAAAPVAPKQLPIKADDVEINEHLLGSFDAVARLPNGLPVRFRCREWADALVLRDTARGIVIEQRAPRLEVVPVSFETY